MKDTFDFTSYVRSGRLHEGSYNAPLNPLLVQALDNYSHDYVTIGSLEWDQMVDTIRKVTDLTGDDLTDFLGGDSGGATLWDYAEALDIRIKYEDDFEEEEPHQTTDTYAGPKGIEEIVKEVLGKKLSEIQMGFEYNPKSVTGTGKKRGPKPIAFPYYELKEKFPEHFRLQTKDKAYTMLVSRDVIEAISQLKDAGRNARSRQLTKLQDELRSLTTQTRRVLIKGTEGQRTFPVMGKEMYIVNWPIMGPNKTKEFLWLNPTQKEFQEGLTNFQIDENYLD
jgi:hypothetical protein